MVETVPCMIQTAFYRECVWDAKARLKSGELTFPAALSDAFLQEQLMRVVCGLALLAPDQQLNHNRAAGLAEAVCEGFDARRRLSGLNSLTRAIVIRRWHELAPRP